MCAPREAVAANPQNDKEEDEVNEWSDGVARGTAEDKESNEEGRNHRAGEQRRADPRRARYQQQNRAENFQASCEAPEPLADSDGGEHLNPHFTVGAEFGATDQEKQSGQEDLEDPR